MTKRRLIQAGCGILIVALLGTALWWLWDQKYYVFARNFREVEPGRIYAGGYQHPGPLRRIIERNRIKTVLSLANLEDAFDADEVRMLRDAGVRLVRLPLPQHVDDDERLDAVDEAVAILSDPANQPIYVHCWGGRHRTGVAIAVHRLRNCGWTEERAMHELLHYGGASEGATWPTRVVHQYAQRIKDMAANGSAATAPR